MMLPLIITMWLSFSHNYLKWLNSRRGAAASLLRLVTRFWAFTHSSRFLPSFMMRLTTVWLTIQSKRNWFFSHTSRTARALFSNFLYLAYRESNHGLKVLVESACVLNRIEARGNPAAPPMVSRSSGFPDFQMLKIMHSCGTICLIFYGQMYQAAGLLLANLTVIDNDTES